MPGRGAVLEREGGDIAGVVEQAQRVGEIGLALAGEADDEVAGQRDIGPRGADALDQSQIVGGGVAAVHGGEDAVGAGLHRQMQIGHQRIEIAMGGDEIVVHVARMAGGVAQAVDARDFGEAEQQPAEAPVAAVGPFAMPGVDVLAEQRELAHAAIGKARRFGDDGFDRPRDLGAARIGHDAEGAELVAAFLHGEEGGRLLRVSDGRGRRRWIPAFGRNDERACRGHRISRRRRTRWRRRGGRRELRRAVRQALIGLRADDQIDHGRAGGRSPRPRPARRSRQRRPSPRGPRRARPALSARKRPSSE